MTYQFRPVDLQDISGELMMKSAAVVTSVNSFPTDENLLGEKSD